MKLSDRNSPHTLPQEHFYPEEEYAGYFGQTASSYGHVLCQVISKRSAKDIDIVSWHHRAAPEYLTTWVESHDTYCNAHETAGLTDTQIRMAWVLLTARQNGTPLFYSRPMNSSPLPPTGRWWAWFWDAWE